MIKNHFRRLELNRHDAHGRIHQAMERLSSDARLLDNDLFAIMTTPDWLEHYRRLHLQYETLGAALTRLDYLENELLEENWESLLGEFRPLTGKDD